MTPQYVGQRTSPPSLPWSLHSFNSSTYHSVQQRWWTQAWSVVTTIFPLTTVRTSRRLRLIAGHGVLMRSSDGVMPYPEVFLQGSYLGEDLLFWERAKQSSRMIWSVLTRCGKPEASWLDKSTNSQEKPSVTAAHLDTLGFVLLIQHQWKDNQRSAFHSKKDRCVCLWSLMQTRWASAKVLQRSLGDATSQIKLDRRGQHQHPCATPPNNTYACTHMLACSHKHFFPPPHWANKRRNRGTKEGQCLGGMESCLLQAVNYQAETKWVNKQQYKAH